MSGWDTPSRPTWDPQDGPEDSTQAFLAPDGSGADDPWSQPVGLGWGGSGAADDQDFGRSDFGASDFGGVNASGPDFGGSDLGRADRREPGFPPESNGFPPESNGFSPDQNGFPPDQNGFPPDQNGFPRGGASADFFPQEFEQRRPGATLAGRHLPGTGSYPSGPQASARDEPPWPGPARQESARQESARPDYGRVGEYGRSGEYGRPDLGRADLGRADVDRPSGPSGPNGPSAPGQDFPRRDPGRADFSAYSTYSGQPDQAEQAPPAANRGEAEQAARMDPALQDFFAPTKPDPRYSGGRPSQAAQSPALPAPNQSGPDYPDRGQQPPRRGNGHGDGYGDRRADGRADGRGPRRPARMSDPWEDPTAYPSPGPRDGQERPRPRGGRLDADELEPASRRKLLLTVGVVVVLVVAGGAYLALHGSGSNNPNASAGSTPTASTSAPASTPTAAAKPKTTGTANNPNVAGGASSAGSYVLSAPSTAAGFPIGTDPKFLATATSTAGAIEQSGISGGGGTVTGSPVSASYTLPDEQTIEFVGYQGTFNPTTVMANLKAYGSSEKTYPAGPNGGDLACANTTATASTPSGAVCVWVTKSTLGFAEFFTQADGPEALNSAQAKGAEDTVNLRASVEKLKS